CIAGAWHLTRLLGGAGWQVKVAALLAAAQFPLLYYSITGMETGFYAALIVAGLWDYYRKGERVTAIGAALWLGVALTRPEGILYPAVLGAWQLVRLREENERQISVRNALLLLAVA